MVRFFLIFLLFSSGNSVYGGSGNMWSDGDLTSQVCITNVSFLFVLVLITEHW
jgi:hypothetical protein